MRLLKLSSVLCACVWLGACVGPPALQIASFAVDGFAFVATGKGSTDHALSAVADEDCRLGNVVRGRSICVPHEEKDGASAAMATAFVANVPRQADAARLQSIGPATGIRVSFQQSPGMNVAEIAGAPVGADLVGHVDADGTLQVHLIHEGGVKSPAAVFVVPGYARAPGTFTGIVMGARFFEPEGIIR